MLSSSNARWLSLKACVDSTLEQYDVLKEYFRTEVFEDRNNYWKHFRHPKQQNCEN